MPHGTASPSRATRRARGWSPSAIRHPTTSGSRARPAATGPDPGRDGVGKGSPVPPSRRAPPPGPSSTSTARPFRRRCWRPSSSATSGPSPTRDIRRPVCSRRPTTERSSWTGRIKPEAPGQAPEGARGPGRPASGWNPQRNRGHLILTASNEDLAAAARARRFREDLYHRLAVVTMTIPPLRERGETSSAPRSLLTRACAGITFLAKPDAEARTALLAHRGLNVRELANGWSAWRSSPSRR